MEGVSQLVNVFVDLGVVPEANKVISKGFPIPRLAGQVGVCAAADFLRSSTCEWCHLLSEPILPCWFRYFHSS